ncbi:helix-turn-helix domain-containing protein [Aminobacter aminovorans]|uniref:helix-turn-helix domain-containing protein n=1 Tax=Aminobacter aminovorans TaxID=83263 RepID=UPI0035E4304F
MTVTIITADTAASPRKPVPIPPGTAISVPSAARYAGVSRDTIRRWCKDHGLGVQPGGRGRFRVSFPALSAFLAADDEALAAIRLGAFGDEVVSPYMAGRFEAGARIAG